MTLQQILGSIAALSDDERLLVAALGIGDDSDVPHIEVAWIEECEARLRDLDAGAATVDASQVLARWRPGPAV